LNSKERVLAAISLEEPDRIPLDSSFTQETSSRLLERFGLDNEADLRIRLGLDVMHCGVNDGFLSPANRDKAATYFPDGSYVTQFGVRAKNVKAGGVRFLEHPIRTHKDLTHLELPDPSEEHRYLGISKTINGFSREYAILCDAGWGLFEKSWALRGFTNFLTDMYRSPGFVESLIDILLDFQIEVTKRVCEYPIDMILFGDDFGMQDKLMMPADLWRKMLKPRWAGIMAIPARKGIPIMFHSDGNIMEIIPDLMEIGVNVLDPIQPKALNPSRVKERFGETLALHGLIDIQDVLPFYSSTGVQEAVKGLIGDVAPGGGVILSPTHTVLPDVPLDNYLSFLKAVRKRGRYKP